MDLPSQGPVRLTTKKLREISRRAIFGSRCYEYHRVFQHLYQPAMQLLPRTTKIPIHFSTAVWRSQWQCLNP